ncbi:zinc finger MYM-type protein 1-like [Asparagus officinalis]|uniref:zinc finger MYM-type protein 1-like n=1 Tax=Asparagus officinalis TaxID=4686 RepID=UPI00098E32B3|nr:zinc finger MYM-type protein 1-like [Asparagus officinalis]
MQIDIAIDQLNELILFFEKYRENGFKEAITEAKKVASEMEIETVFREKRIIRRKRQFDESATEETMLSPEESFRIKYFPYIVDQAISSLKSMFEQFRHYEEVFGFLFDLKKFSIVDDASLKAYCAKLEGFLKHDSHFDIDGEDLFLELKFLREYLPKEIKKVIDVLNYLKKLDGTFLNAWIAYRILLTIPVTDASAERSFSKLKLIKSDLRSTMSQERLNGLAILSIKKNIVEKLDYTSLLNDFASKNARRCFIK